MKNKVDKLDVDKLKPVPVDLKKISNVVENDVVKKAVYDELVEKAFIDTSALVKKKLTTTQKLMKSKIE